ncbi:hypothetical protein [Flavobacterium sp. H122]|uniref:hypothetical protein n=1 Tax=Flavobacterium sp. H122 TaxID=2529860 RepID=UPI0010AACD2F|nr:hypothetical protein [Flavobacterium sp. H122]
MKNVALILFSVFTMLLSCKCKKAVTEADSVKTVSDTSVNADSSSALVANLNDSSPMQESTIVEYTANTRGYHLKIKLTQNELAYTNQRDSNEFTKVSLTDAQKAELQKLLKEIKAEKISELKAPTQKRLYDGAAHADLTITVNGNSYHSAGFDHGYPPAQIEKFINKLVSYTEQN